MAVIKAFPCVHPKKELAARVAALPYDVYNRAEARLEAKKDPISFLNIDRPETGFPEEQDMYAPEVYQHAHDLLAEQIAEGIYIEEKRPMFYLYELTMNGRSQTGLVACASIDDYLEGTIKKHENTREEKEIDRIHHVDTCDAQTGPIFLAYRGQETLKELLEAEKGKEPMFAFISEDGIGHRGWGIADEETIRQIEAVFEGMDSLYIADGHHRAASAVKVGTKRRAEHPDYDGTESFNYFLSVLFPDEELMIMDYNRVLKDLNGQEEAEVLAKIKEICNVEKVGKAYKPETKGHMGMLLGDSWYHLNIKPQYQKKDPVDGLDVAILQNEILNPIFGIEDPKTSSRIDFIGGIRGLSELEKRVQTDCRCAFAMYPTSIAELFSVADAGRLMPPKSTWFEPKLRSGLFIHKIG